ncbi:MAG: hypothetical protein ACLQIB_52165 [Isosphaeraceae bacterium]
MKSSFAGLLALALVTLSGCNEGTPGGSGITSSHQKQPAYGEAENTFKLSVPGMSTTLHQGETKEVTIGIDRGKNFEGDVTLKFADGPEGVTIESASPIIKHGDTEAKVTFKATSDASLGDFTVKVTGHPTMGPDATSEYKINVAKK